MSTDGSGHREPTLYFEELAVGDTFSIGPRTVTREEIVSFAERYDPRPFHLGEPVEYGDVDGPVASGWHTIALCTRMQVEGVIEDVAVMGGRGVDDLRWPTRVRPGDTLSGTVTVVDRRPSSQGDRGYVDFRTELLNGADDPVLEMVSHLLVRTRSGAE